MSQLMQSSTRNTFAGTSRSPARNAGLALVTAIHATVLNTAGSIARNGPPLDMTTQLCSVVAHLDLDIAGHAARKGLRSIFRVAPVTTNVQPQAA